MGWLSRFQQIRKNRQRFEADAAQHAGSEAERVLGQKMLSIIDGTSCRLWMNRRIPVGTRRSEIDAILSLGDRLWLVELKNWSGALFVHDGRLIQRRRYDGGEIDHGPLVVLMAERQEALARWCVQQGGRDFVVEPFVVFANPRLEIHPSAQEALGSLLVSEAVFLQHLQSVVNSYRDVPALSSVTARGWPRLFSLFRGTKTADSRGVSELSSVERAVDVLSTWDTLELHGGREVSGDILRGTPLEDGQRRVSLADRRRLWGYEVEVPRSYWQVFRSSAEAKVRLHGRSQDYGWFPLPEDASIRFQAAGAAEPEDVPLRHVVRVRFGSKNERNPRKRSRAGS